MKLFRYLPFAALHVGAPFAVACIDPPMTVAFTSEQQDSIDTSVAHLDIVQPVAAQIIAAMPPFHVDAEGGETDAEGMVAALKRTHEIVRIVYRNDRIVGAHEARMPKDGSSAFRFDWNTHDNFVGNMFIVVNVDKSHSDWADALLHEAGHFKVGHDATIEDELRVTEMHWGDPEVCEVILDHHDYSYMLNCIYTGPLSILRHLDEDRKALYEDAAKENIPLREFDLRIALPPEEEWLDTQIEYLWENFAFFTVADIPQDVVRTALATEGWYESEGARRELLRELYRKNEARREAREAMGKRR